MLIWGSRTRVSVLLLVRFVCGVCHHDAPQRILEQVRTFTLFFIPLFTTSRQHLVECVGCGARYPVTQEYVEQQRQWQAQHPA